MSSPLSPRQEQARIIALHTQLAKQHKAERKSAKSGVATPPGASSSKDSTLKERMDFAPGVISEIPAKKTDIKKHST